MGGGKHEGGQGICRNLGVGSGLTGPVNLGHSLKVSEGPDRLSLSLSPHPVPGPSVGAEDKEMSIMDRFPALEARHSTGSCVYCCITSYQNLSSFKQNPSILYSLGGQEPRHWLAVFSVQHLTRPESKC